MRGILILVGGRIWTLRREQGLDGSFSRQRASQCCGRGIAMTYEARLDNFVPSSNGSEDAAGTVYGMVNIGIKIKGSSILPLTGLSAERRAATE
jgi:hypothetical protein